MVGGGADKAANTVVGHEHIFFDDGSDIGYGDDGIYSGEDRSKYSQCEKMDASKDEVMDRIDKIRGEFGSGDYDIRSRVFGGNNCQDFVDRVRGFRLGL